MDNVSEEKPKAHHTAEHEHAHGEHKVQRAKPASRRWWYIGIAVLIIIVIAAAVALEMQGPNHNTKTTISSNSPFISQINRQQTAPKAPAANIVLSPNNPKALEFIAAIHNYSVAIPQFTVSYTGTLKSSIVEYVSDASGSPTSYLLAPSGFTGNLTSTYSKYLNASRSDTMLQITKTAGSYNVSALGTSVNTTTYRFNNTSYTCTQYPNASCVKGSSGFGYTSSSPLSFLDNYTLSGIYLTNTIYNGRNCTLVGGNMTNTAANPTTVASTAGGNFSACVTEPYNIALYLHANFDIVASRYYGTNGSTETAAEGLKLDLYVRNITNSASQSYVNSFNKSLLTNKTVS